MKTIISLSQKFNYFQIILIILFIIIGIFIRFNGLNKQMTEGDDIGVASFITISEDNSITVEYILNKINDRNNSSFNAPMHKFFRSLNKHELLMPFLPYVNKMIQTLAIPRAWTYAPFQYLITPHLISQNQSYQQVLFWGRFPSFIFASLAIFLMLVFFLKINARNIFLACFSSLMLLIFSLENIIYSRHMSNYALGVLAAILLILILIFIIENKTNNFKKGIIIGLALAVISNMQYQIIFLIPVFFIVWLFEIIKNENNNRKNILKTFLSKQFLMYIFSFICYFCFMLPSLILFVIPKAQLGLSKSVGIPHNFYFDAFGMDGVWETIKYSAIFFSKNGFVVFRYITSYMSYDNVFFNISAFIILILTVLGFIRMIYSKYNLVRNLGYFFVGSLLVTVVLIIINNIPLSPTRHYLIYLPYIAICVGFGISEIYAFIQSKFKIKLEFFFTFVLIFLFLAPFLSDYFKITSDRKDNFSEKMLCELTRKYDPKYVIAQDLETNLMFMGCFSNWSRENGIFTNSSTDNNETYMYVSNSDNLCNGISSKICDTELYKILYNYKFDDGITLSISNEAKTSYNRLYIRIIKFDD